MSNENIETEFMSVGSVDGEITAVLKLEELDHESSTAIRNFFEKNPTIVTGKTVNLDFGLVRFAASTAIGQLILLNKILKKRGKKLVLFNLTRAMEELTQVTKLDRIIKIK